VSTYISCLAGVWGAFGEVADNQMSLGSAGYLPGGLVRISGLAVATHRHKGIKAGFDQALTWKATTRGSSVGRSLGGRRRPSEDHEYHQLLSSPLIYATSPTPAKWRRSTGC
jgi:hypothetical protein